MSAQTLQYRSPERLLELRSECKPHCALVGSWRVSERYEPNTHHYVQEGLGSYRLILESSVDSQEQVWAGLSEAEAIARQLDVAWCYVCGSPFFSAKPTFVSFDAPTGWTGNTREVEIAIQRARGLGYAAAVQVIDSHWLSLPFLPLAKVLAVRQAMLGASPIIQELVELHIAAHKCTFERGRPFFLAKALELAGAFYGKERAARNIGLQRHMLKIGIAPHLTQPVAWLFTMANTRSDVRHVVSAHSPVDLHPRMTATEREDFLMNAEFVLRGFICTQLGVEIIL